MTYFAPPGVRFNPTKGNHVLKKKLMGFTAAFAVAGLIVAAPMAANAEEVVDPTVSTTVLDQTVIESSNSSETDKTVDSPASSGEVTTPAEETGPGDSADTSDQAAVDPSASSDADESTEKPESAGDVSVPPSVGESAPVQDPQQADPSWQPKSTFTLEAPCVPKGKQRVPLQVNENDAEGESVYPWTLDGVVQASDAGNWTIDVGTHTYSYVVNNNKTGEKSEQGPFTLVVVACEDLVSPVGPTIDDTKQSVEIPEDPNFTYAVKDGEELQPGVHVLGPVGAGNIIATPKPGVSVKPDATTQWPFNFPPQPPKLITPPVLVPIGEHLPIPSMDGVVYVGPDGVVTGTVTLPDGVEQCFDTVPANDDVKFTPGSVIHQCFTYHKPTDNSGSDNGGGSGDGGQGSNPNGGDNGAGSGSGPTDSNTSGQHQPSSEPPRTLAATGSSIPTGLPVGGAIALAAGFVLMLLVRRSRNQVI